MLKPPVWFFYFCTRDIAAVIPFRTSGSSLGIAEKMSDEAAHDHLCIFHAPDFLGRHQDGHIRHGFQYAANRTANADGPAAGLGSKLESKHQRGSIARRADADNHITGSGDSPQLVQEHAMLGQIVGHRSKRRWFITQRINSMSGRLI
jgi:hypothetical protein